MFLITGITGHTGGAAAETLLAQGKKVRALVRDTAKAKPWADKGVELMQGDVNDAAALTKALAGVEGAYLMMPPNFAPSPDFAEAKAILAAYVQALGSVHVPKVVALSSIGSAKTEKLGLITVTSLMERAFEKLPMPVAFIRAGSFMENFLYGLHTGQGGVFPIMYTPTDRPVPMIATKDIGAEAAKLLTSDWTGKRYIELGTDLTPDAFASTIGEVLGKEVKAQAVPREAWPAVMESQGVPKGMSAPYEQMLESFNAGWIAFGVPGTEPVAATTTAKEVLTEANRAH